MLRLVRNFRLAGFVVLAIAAVGNGAAAGEKRDADWPSDVMAKLAARPERIVVAVFLGTDCPLARLYANRLEALHRKYAAAGVAVVGVNSNQGDSLAKVREFAATHRLSFPIWKDDNHHAADALGATRTPEALVLDEARQVRYQGAIDDQYTPGTNRTSPTVEYVARAVEELLDGQSVSMPRTQAVGCYLDRRTKPAASSQKTFTRDVAPIVFRHCTTCHRPGQVAPFSLLTYEDAAGHAETIREVVEQKRMPPWSASPHVGRFANDPSLSAEEIATLATWVSEGCAEGNPADLPKPPQFAGQWTIEPELIVAMAAPFQVSAEGTIDYQTFIVDPQFAADTWVQAIEVLPGNRAVVHHVNVYLLPPQAASDEFYSVGELGDELLAIFVPGNTATVFPQGMAKLIPAGWRLKLSIHYVANGSPQTDVTRVGFQRATEVRRQVATKMTLDENFSLPPFSADTEVKKEWAADRDLLLLAMQPHMHLRGRSMRFEATYPDGRTEVLLDVPQYDFMWQHRYLLAEPKRLPARTVLRCVGHYDNSAANPNNPDPSVTVRAGQLTTDEMFQGNWEVCLADQDLVAESSPPVDYRAAWLGALTGAMLVVQWYALHRWSRANASRVGVRLRRATPHA